MRFAAQAACVATLLAASTAVQAVTIVQFRQNTAGHSAALTNSGTSYMLSSIGSQTVQVTLFDPNDAANTAVVDATWSFSASGDDAAVVLGGTVFQDFDAGAFSLTALAPFSFLGATGTNILSGAFTMGTLAGPLNGRSPTFSVSVPIGTLSSTSDFFGSANLELSNFSLGMSDASRSLRVGPNGRLRSFSAASVGTFGATSVVPEPETWAMLIVGFGMVGLAARHRRRERYRTQ